MWKTWTSFGEIKHLTKLLACDRGSWSSQGSKYNIKHLHAVWYHTVSIVSIHLLCAEMFRLNVKWQPEISMTDWNLGGASLPLSPLLYPPLPLPFILSPPPPLPSPFLLPLHCQSLPVSFA